MEEDVQCSDYMDGIESIIGSVGRLWGCLVKIYATRWFDQVLRSRWGVGQSTLYVKNTG